MRKVELVNTCFQNYVKIDDKLVTLEELKVKMMSIFADVLKNTTNDNASDKYDIPVDTALLLENLVVTAYNVDCDQKIEDCDVCDGVNCTTIYKISNAE